MVFELTPDLDLKSVLLLLDKVELRLFNVELRLFNDVKFRLFIEEVLLEL